MLSFVWRIGGLGPLGYATGLVLKRWCDVLMIKRSWVRLQVKCLYSDVMVAGWDI